MRLAPSKWSCSRLRLWDANCPRHIPQKLDVAEAAEVVAHLRSRIESLEAENGKLRAALGESSKEA
jgi:hypothetical protein